MSLLILAVVRRELMWRRVLNDSMEERPKSQRDFYAPTPREDDTWWYDFNNSKKPLGRFKWLWTALNLRLTGLKRKQPEKWLY